MATKPEIETPAPNESNQLVEEQQAMKDNDKDVTQKQPPNDEKPPGKAKEQPQRRLG